jgi:hypothetical protein
LEVIRDVLTVSIDGRPSISDIARCFTERYADEYDRKITPKWIGNIVRRNLQLKTQKSHGVFVLVPQEKAKLT